MLFLKQPIFLRRKIMVFKKQPTEAEILTYLKEGRLKLPPLDFVAAETDLNVAASNANERLDALLTLRWRNRTYCFGVETKRLWTPKIVTEAIEQARRKAAPSGVYPLIVAPYLGQEQLVTLEAQDVSGIDLCGNGVVIVPDELVVVRTGSPNRFRWEGIIQNVYRRNSSIAARVFLLVPEFNSVNEALEQIRKRGGEVTLGTVSKVCKALEADLIIERFRREASEPLLPKPQSASPQPPRVGPSPFARQMRLLQPEKLLDLLAENYVPPTIGRTYRGKFGPKPEELRTRLASWSEKSGGRVALAGASSVEAYAIMAREPMLSCYCSDVDGVIESLGNDLRETDRFANVTFMETRDDNFVYFDSRPGLWASPIQSYLELIAGDKRERETAEQVRKVILAPLADLQGKE